MKVKHRQREKNTSPTRAARPAGAKRLLGVVVALILLAGCAYLLLQRIATRDYRGAQAALRQRDNRRASRLLAWHLKTSPQDLRARFLAAQTLRRLGDFQASGDQLDEVVRQGGATPETELEYRLTRIQQGNFNDTEILVAQSAENPADPNSALILEAVIEGQFNSLWQSLRSEMSGEQAAVNKSEFERAQQTVDQWLRHYTLPIDQAQGHVWRGKLHSIAREYPKSRTSFLAALRFQPDNDTAREYLGLLLAQHSPEEAAQHLQIVHENDPTNRKVSRHLAIVRRSLGQLDRAEQILDELLTNDPRDVSLLVERGLLALDRQLPKDAEIWLRQAAARAPNDVRIILPLSQCLQQVGQVAEARRHYDRFLQIESQTGQLQN